MPKLKISVSTSSPPSPSTSTLLSPNSSTPTRIRSETFEGDVLVRIKGFTGESADGKERRSPEGEPAYFESASRKGKTWSIFVRGRFLEEIDGDDLVFGNVFENPIRDSLPWGTSVAVKFMHYLDPTMESDFYADKPWALSPLLCTTPFLSLTPHPPTSPLPPFSSTTDLEPLKENSLDGLVANLRRRNGQVETDDLDEVRDEEKESWARKSWVNVKENRKAVRIGKEDLVTIDFVQAFLDFNDLSVSLPSVGFHVDLLKYWDGQPVTFVCRNRSGTKTFFSVSFEITDAEPATKAGKNEIEKKEAEEEEEEVEISDEVD
ncbi:hypothetical protein BDY24DRAFT_378323 [Mrakia frigida]|uniref:DUF1769 domain-containing protein n=1 Tax=Mrakia frigida TaxID=29902 RepID=UPI003FCC1F1A